MNNFISVNHQGGLCNTLFKFSAAISLARDNDVDYLFSKEYIRPIDPNYDNYKDNIYRNLNFIDSLPKNNVNYYENNFNFNRIEYSTGTNLILNGYFQSEKYFENHKEYIIDLFKPTDELKLKIRSLIPKIENHISIHVRRGDYLTLPTFHPQQNIEYYIEAVNLLGIDKNYLIFSDDLEGIKEMFEFIPNKKFVTLKEDYLDLYAMCMCEHNIICNSTFSWWGAYLNENKNKKIISPSKWFGTSFNHLDSSDIIPKEWIKI